MNLPELVTAFLQRGFDYQSNAEAEQLLNDAYLIDICADQDWPFKEEIVTGTAPLTIGEFDALEYVIDTTEERKLHPLDRRNLTDAFPTFAETGSPRFYYLTEGTVLNVYPTNTTDSLLVRYYISVPELTGSATPIIPKRWHSLIVDGAVARAYEGSDDYELAQNANAKFQERLEKMRTSILGPYRDGPEQFIAVTDPAAY
jgi:hypothetical protein